MIFKKAVVVFTMTLACNVMRNVVYLFVRCCSLSGTGRYCSSYRLLDIYFFPIKSYRTLIRMLASYASGRGLGSTCNQWSVKYMKSKISPASNQSLV